MLRVRVSRLPVPKFLNPYDQPPPPPPFADGTRLLFFSYLYPTIERDDARYEWPPLPVEKIPQSDEDMEDENTEESNEEVDDEMNE